MMELRAFKFRLYPNKEQEQKLAQFFGAKRWVFNHFLFENIQRRSREEKHLSNFDINKEITQLKKQSETDWLRTVDDWCLKNASEDLSNAYSNFFKSITGKRKGPKVSVPRFKSKSNHQSYRTRNIKVDFENNVVVLPKIKNIKCELHRQFDGKIKSATISKNPSGKYFISILVEQEQQLLDSTGKEIGIDLGLKDLIILSNGIKFAHPEQQLVKSKLALKRQQKKLSRMTRGSKSFEKQRIKVARCFEKITNIKNWYYHNISTFLVRNYDSIFMEDLHVSGMLKNRKLSRKIHETGWSILVNMIKYKSDSSGRLFHQINRFSPSSKTCSCCGHKLETLSLGTRDWICPVCESHHDRDLNAAVNIKNFGQIDCYEKIIHSVETTELGEIPESLQKFTTKIERSFMSLNVCEGSRKATRSLVV
jgi:putative transposase